MLRKITKHLFYNSITRIAGDAYGEVGVRVLTGPGRGLRLRLDLVHRAESAYWFGKYDRAILETLARVIRPGWNVWDAGTYLGYYTAFLARLVGPKGMVVAIEPDAQNLKRTRATVDLNGFTNVQYLNAAVSDSTGSIEFITTGNTNSRIPGSWIGATRLDYERNAISGESTLVEAVRLDDIFPARSQYKPDLIKLDIEGAEAAALRGAHRLATNERPRFLVELHNPECDRAVYDFATEFDYHMINAVTGGTLTRPEQVNGTVLATPKEL